METNTLLEYYKKNTNTLDTKTIVAIIDALCINQYPTPNANFKQQVIEFVDYFKKQHLDFYQKNQDMLVFRMYADIIKDSIKKKNKEVHKKLNKQEKERAQSFSKKIFSLKKDMVYVVSAGTQTYMEQLTSQSKLTAIIEYLIYCKNAVILFYVNHKNEKTVFGFMIKDGNFMEISEEGLIKIAPNKNIKYSTFSNISA